MAGNPVGDRETCDLDAAAALPPLPPYVSAGALIVARAARWRIESCVDREDCRELHLRGTGDGTKRVLLWPFDRPAPVAAPRRARVVSLPRWTKAAARVLDRTVDPLAPRAAFTGHVLPYQLSPAIAMASGVARVLLADEVGLGKTIQAGWILADLLAREPDARALIAVPASLRDQWASELVSFFAVAPSRVDAAWLRSAVADRPADVSPWAAPGAYLGSIDFLKRPDVARSIRAVLWDLLIVDEAHGAVAPSERHAALAAIAAVSRRVVLITATPYSGDAAAFRSLTALGAARDEPLPLMFRRSRDDVGDRRARRHRLMTVRIGRAEARLQRLLERYSRDVWRDAPPGADGARLAMTILRKRALSSPAAVLRSLTRRRELLRGAIAPPVQLTLFEETDDADDMMPEGALAAPGLADARREERWLAALIEAAGAAGETDSKARRLLRLLSRIGDEPVIVFTEYRDTLRRLAEALPAASHLHGGLANAERAEVQRRFNREGGVLLATDAAADGLNLQRRCRLVVNYELPWNPARLEQRIGRVDRIGQRRIVHAITLVARDTAEDLVVARLARRLAGVAATLGERDRLASLITDVRTARAVIAGVPLEIDVPVNEDEAPNLPRASFPVDHIASQVRAAQASGSSAPTSIAALRASGVLQPGFVAIVRAAVVNDRGIVAERPFVFHLAAGCTPKPVSQRDARRLARPAIDAIERASAVHPQVRGWMDDVTLAHAAAVQRRTARERTLRPGRSALAEIQPGLFDRRALLNPARDEAAGEDRRDQHDRYIRTLEAARSVRVECSAQAVLVLWR
jgi:superfamily II DNA or RNA helicase